MDAAQDIGLSEGGADPRPELFSGRTRTRGVGVSPVSRHRAARLVPSPRGDSRPRGVDPGLAADPAPLHLQQNPPCTEARPRLTTSGFRNGAFPRCPGPGCPGSPVSGFRRIPFRGIWVPGSPGSAVTGREFGFRGV